MAMIKLQTLCSDCAELKRNIFKVKQTSKTTTEKKPYCENCNTARDLHQYLVQSKR